MNFYYIFGFCIILLASHATGFSYNDLDDERFEHHLLRHRRSPGPGGPGGPGGKHEMCCGKDTTKIPEIPSECEGLKNIGDESKMGHLASMVCVAECSEKATGSWDDEKLDKDLFIAGVKDIYNKDWAMEVANKSFETCVEHATTMKAGFISKLPENKCNPIPFLVTGCIMKDLEVNCPKEEQVDTPHCNGMRERLAKMKN